MNGGWVPWLIFGILGMSVIANIILVRSAAADPNYINEPDYYREAVAWDEHMAQQRASASLGWHVSASLAVSRDQRAQLTLHLVDRDGKPLSDARVHATTSPNLCALQRTNVDARSDVAVDVGPACPGLWRIDVEAERGDAHFVERVVAEMSGKS